jgi:hypothetical protein
MNPSLASNDYIRSVIITIAILNIIHLPVFNLKQFFSETGFCLFFQWQLLSWAWRQRLPLSIGPNGLGSTL